MSRIIIISLEGKESNTEKNFFRGMACHIHNDILFIEAFQKTSNSEKSQNKIKGEIKSVFRHSFDKFKDKNTQIYFIGDGDVKYNFQSMEQSKKFLLMNMKNIIFNQKSLMK